MNRYAAMIRWLLRISLCATVLSVSRGQETRIENLQTDDLVVLAGRKGFENFEQQLGAHFGAMADAIFSERQAKVDSIDTVAEFDEYRKTAQAHYLENLGPFPEKTPLNVTYYGHVDCGDHTLSRLTFESQPGYLVTANLYSPKGQTGPFPLVLSPIGHWWGKNGEMDTKGYPLIQERCVGLARRGYYVLAFDPFGQGERKMMFDASLAMQSKMGQATHQHITLNLQLHLTGQNLTRLFVWDCIRGIDVLAGLENADTTRIAVTGASGGGSQTQFVAGADPRIAAVIPVCANQHFGIAPHNGKGNLDGEQNIPGRIQDALQWSDLLIMTDIKDILLMNASDDTQIREGSIGMYNDLRNLFSRIYPENPERSVTYYLVGAPHSYNRDFREVMYNWLNRRFDKPDAGNLEQPITIRGPGDINVTQSGSIEELGSETPLSLNAKIAQAIVPSLPLIESKKQLRRFQTELKAKIETVLQLEPLPKEIVAETISVVEGVDFTLEKLYFETKENLKIPAVLVSPKNATPTKDLRTVVYIHERGKANGVSTIISLAQSGKRVFAVDTRGFDEFPDPHPEHANRDKGNVFKGYKIIYGNADDDADFNAFCYESGQSLFGMRLMDIRFGIHYLRSRPDVSPETIDIYGVGDGAMLALHAAVLDERIENIHLDRLTLSFKDLAEQPYAAASPFLFIHNVLAHYDVDHLISGLAPRRIVMENICGVDRKVLPEQTVHQRFAKVADSFEQLNASEAMRISVSSPIE